MLWGVQEKLRERSGDGTPHLLSLYSFVSLSTLRESENEREIKCKKPSAQIVVVQMESKTQKEGGQMPTGTLHTLLGSAGPPVRRSAGPQVFFRAAGTPLLPLLRASGARATLLPGGGGAGSVSTGDTRTRLPRAVIFVRMPERPASASAAGESTHRWPVVC